MRVPTASYNKKKTASGLSQSTDMGMSEYTKVPEFTYMSYYTKNAIWKMIKSLKRVPIYDDDKRDSWS